MTAQYPHDNYTVSGVTHHSHQELLTDSDGKTNGL